jgi:hypothetical protein
MAQLNDLFSVDLNTKMDFLEDKRTSNSDGIYRVDLSKVKDKKRGYRSVLRFLPNLTKEMELEQTTIEKIAHYVNIKNVKELSGFFDSPKNFGEDCALSSLYYAMTKSGNAIQVEKAKCLQYSKKYYSYVLVIEDEQQPDLVGKIMVFQYGKGIHEKIASEKTGEISGTDCNVFDWAVGKDFVLIAKEIVTGEITYPDYKNSTFKPDITSLPIYNAEKNVFKNVPTVKIDTKDGKIDSIDPRFQQIVVDFLLARDHELSDYAPKALTPELKQKIIEITAFLTGNVAQSYKAAPVASSDDFDLEETLSGSSNDIAPHSVNVDEDEEEDFFADM